MSRQAIGIGAAANDGTGDPLRTAFTKANDNFSEIYSLLGGDTLTVAGARTALGLGTTNSPTFAGVTLGALSSIHFTGLTANALLLSDGTDLTQSANLTFDGTTLTATGLKGPLFTDNSADSITVPAFTSTANTGTGIKFRNTEIDFIISGTRQAYVSSGSMTIAGSLAATSFKNGSVGGSMALGTAAGGGLTITAGTATTDVNALSATQTWNAAGVAFTGWKFTITDTASAAGSLAMQILGGASGTTNLISLNKAGQVSVPLGSITAPAYSFNGIPGYGIYSTGTNVIISVNGGNNLVNFPNSSLEAIRISSASSYGFSSGDAVGSGADTNISRGAAGLLLVGTGGAGSFAGSLKLTSVIHAGVAFASLNASPTAGEVQYVTDSTTATWGATIAGGGANKVLAWYNGTNWTVAGA